MRFGIQVVGSEGDVRPLVALGAGLTAAGHQVTISICSDRRADFSRLCESHGLHYFNSGEYLDFAGSGIKASSLSGIEWHREIHREFFVASGNEEIMYQAALSLCADNDVLISHYLCYPAKAAVVKTGIPHVSVQLTGEHTPTKYRPCRITMPDLGWRLNLMSWQELSQGAGIGLKEPYLQFWNSKGLPPFEDLWSLYFSDDLNLLGVSRLFCPQHPDWDELHVVTGFMNLPPTTPAPQLSARIEQFLAAGEPPVFMTFGSVQEIYPGSNVEQNVELFVDAAIESGCRAVIQTSGADKRKYPPESCHALTDQILFTDWIPYDEIFAKCSLAVHHSGIGTCQLSLKHNRPSVLVPFTAHQLTFAQAMHQLKVCPAPIMRTSVTSAALAAQITAVLSDTTYQQQAEVAGAKLRSEHGVRRAVDVITKRFGCAAKQIE